MDSNHLKDAELITLAVDALKKRERRYFLFIDNLEYALTANHELPPTLIEFLEKFFVNEVRTNVVFASTRVPIYPASIASSSDVIRLDMLPNIYIHQCFDEWLSDHPKHREYLNSSHMDNLVKVADGYPLAALMLATSLKSGIPPHVILQSSEIKRLRLSLAGHILNSLLQERLSELESLILQTLGLINEPIHTDDLISIETFTKYSPQQIREAVYKLIRLLLLSDTDEGMLSLHSFVSSYFRDQLRGEEGKQIRDRLVKEIGSYAYKKTLALHQELQMKSDGKEIDDEVAIEFTGEIFRYALTASKFLRMDGKDYLAETLPIDIKGSVREMVLYFYQQVRDYEKALEYSDKWLRIRPDDQEIRLYKARCLRNLGDGDKLVEAERVLAEIESVAHSKFFRERISNEKGKIALQRGEENSAMLVYEQAIDDGATLPDIYISVARIYLRKARDLPDNSLQRQQFAKKAVDLLEKGRGAAESGAVAIDVYYLDLYIDALVEIEDDEAYPMLEQALVEMPTDARLNYRMAEIRRKNLNLQDSIKHAQRAIKYGSIAAHLTLANVYLSQAFLHREEGNQVESNKQLNLALDHVKIYRDRSPYSKHIIAVTLMSRIYRARGDWESAKEIIKPFEEIADRHLRCEQCEISLHEAEQIAQKGKYKAAFDMVKNTRTLLSTVYTMEDIHSQDLITRTANLYDEYKQYLQID